MELVVEFHPQPGHPSQPTSRVCSLHFAAKHDTPPTSHNQASSPRRLLLSPDEECLSRASSSLHVDETFESSLCPADERVHLVLLKDSSVLRCDMTPAAQNFQPGQAYILSKYVRVRKILPGGMDLKRHSRRSNTSRVDASWARQTHVLLQDFDPPAFGWKQVTRNGRRDFLSGAGTKVWTHGKFCPSKTDGLLSKRKVWDFMMEHGHMEKGPGGLDADAGSGKRRERNPLPGPPRPIAFRTLEFFEPGMHGWTYERRMKLWLRHPT